MKRTMFKRAAFGAAVIMGMSTGAIARPQWSPNANETLLKQGIAVHTMGVSPLVADGNATLRLYDVRNADYDRSQTSPFIEDVTTFTHHHWDIGSMGNVYGIAIDKKRNIYTAASASWSPGYADGGNRDVIIGYGAIGANTSVETGGVLTGDTPDLNNTLAAGTVYKVDAKSGDVTNFAQLPQVSNITITNEMCEGSPLKSVSRKTGPGLGNIVYDKFHNQFFVSNFSDGHIYRLDENGTVKQDYSNTGMLGLAADGKTVQAPYGLAIDPDGSKLYFGTQETNWHPRLFAVQIAADGSLSGGTIDQGAKLDDANGLQYTQDIGGSHTDDGVWAAYSDIDFTPNGEMVLGVRVGCNGNFATSYIHGGVTYLLTKNNEHYNKAANQVPGNGVTYVGDLNTTNGENQRTGHNRYDVGAIPMRSDGDSNQLRRGPDDGYGGVAVWQQANGDYDFLLTSGDISNEDGVHGFMQVKGDFTVINGLIEDGKVKPYKSVASSWNTDRNRDYKGIGGDVEVLSVLPVSIGSYVWEDTDQDGKQDSNEPCIDGATVSLEYQEQNGSFSPQAKDLNGIIVPDQTTGSNGTCGSYMFDNLPEGNYRVCVTPPVGRGVEYPKTPVETTGDNNDTMWDSNIAQSNGNNHCSGLYSLYLNVEPTETGGYVGDNLDDGAREKWGNMTVDFGFINHTFDLALVKKIQGSASKKYNAGDTVKFTITVYNQGTVEAKNVKVMDYIPSGLILNDNRWTKSGDKAVLNAAIPSIAAGSSKDVEIEFKIDPNLQSESDIVNVAEIKSATNDFNLLDKDSTPDDKVCFNDLANDNDTADINGCDDLDPAVVHIQHHNISPDTDTPGGGGDEANPDCDCNDADAADAMSRFALLLMLLGTLAVAMRFLPRDEQAA